MITLTHKPLPVQFHTYGLDFSSSKLLCRLNIIWQSITIVLACSSFHNILDGVPQGSIVRLLLFNYDLCNIFWVRGIVENNKPYMLGQNWDWVNYWQKKSVVDSIKAIWKKNCDKCELLISPIKNYFSYYQVKKWNYKNQVFIKQKQIANRKLKVFSRTFSLMNT